MKKYFIILTTISAFVLAGCQDNSELEDRVTALEEKVESLSAKEVVSNPVSVNNPNSQPQNDGPKAAIAFTESEYDFGTITQGDKVKHMFEFKNTGENPLIISNARGSCGCTVPNWPKEPIPPGETGQMEVVFNSAGKIGTQIKTVTVTANTNPANTKVKIKSNVVKPEGGAPVQPVQQ